MSQGIETRTYIIRTIFLKKFKFARKGSEIGLKIGRRDGPLWPTLKKTCLDMEISKIGLSKKSFTGAIKKTVYECVISIQNTRDLSLLGNRCFAFVVIFISHE